MWSLAQTGVGLTTTGLVADLLGFRPALGARKRCGGSVQAAPPAAGRSSAHTEPAFRAGILSAGNEPGAPVQDVGARTAGARQLRRSLYWLLRGWQKHSQEPRVAKCGRVRIRRDDVQIHRGKNGRCNYSGLMRCKSKSCPVCVAERRGRYAWQINDVAGQLRASRGVVTYMATFTLRHGVSDSLTETGHGIRRAWQAMCSGRAWKDLRTELGASYIVAEETTHGKNGWHPHLHVLLFLERQDALALEHLRWRLFDRWRKCVVRHVGVAHEPEWQAFDISECHDSEYVSKLGLEMADPGTKHGKAGRTPLQLLKDGLEGDEQALRLYHDFEKIMRGRRDLTWSKDLQPLRREPPRQERTLGASIPAALWDTLRDKPSAPIRLLEACERGGLDAVCWEIELLSDRSSAWQVRIGTERAPPSSS